MTDGTEQQAEALPQLERFEFATRAAGIGYWFCDLPFDTLNWDPQVRDHFGLDSSVVVTIDQFYKSLHPEDRERTRAAVEGSIAKNKPYDIEYRTVAPDGRIRWIRAIGRTFYDRDGRPVRFDGLTQDITLLKDKIGETERQHAELETVYRTAPIGLALFDPVEFRYLRLNDRQAEFFGMSQAEILGKSVTEMAPIEGLREMFEQVAAGDPVINQPLEGELVGRPGEHRYWTVNYFPVWGADGTVQAISAASLEITPQKKAEMALLESEKLAVVGRLASSIAHEINNPLEALTNLLYLAQHSDGLDEVRGYLRSAEQELRRVSAITNQTLRFHKQASRPTANSAESLFDSVLLVFHRKVVNLNVDVQTRFRAGRPVQCFEGEIRQVLSNLVDNALDSMASCGKRQLSLRSRVATRRSANGHEVGLMLTVADTGNGISSATMPRLWDPFFTTKGMLGTGLGLWVSRQIIDRHRGTLRVRSSTRAGRSGSVFTVFLPFDAVQREG